MRIKNWRALKGMFLGFLLQRTGIHPSLHAKILEKNGLCPDAVIDGEEPVDKKDEPAKGKADAPEANEEDEESAEPEEDGNSEFDNLSPNFEHRAGVKVHGIIVGEEDAWVYKFMKMETCTAESVRRDLKKRVTGDIATVFIDSPGGSVTEAAKIRLAIDEWARAKKGRKVLVRVEGWAVSAAADVMFIATNENITMDAASIIGLHVPVVGTQGSARSHRKTAETLDKVLEAGARLYAPRMGMKPAKIIENMYNGEFEVWWIMAHDARKQIKGLQVVGFDAMDEDDPEEMPEDDDPSEKPESEGAPEGEGKEEKETKITDAGGTTNPVDSEVKPTASVQKDGESAPEQDSPQGDKPEGEPEQADPDAPPAESAEAETEAGLRRLRDARMRITNRNRRSKRAS